MPPSPLRIPALRIPALRVTAPRMGALAAATALAAAATLAGCSQPASVGTTAATPATSRPVRASTQPPSRPAVTLTAGTAFGTPAPTFVERTAAPCGGYPTGEQIIALLRRTFGVIPADASVTVQTGPLCVGGWQYTVVTMPERDPLQVVTQGTPTALHLVTAGTDVCTVEVRALAPAGIREITRC